MTNGGYSHYLPLSFELFKLSGIARFLPPTWRTTYCYHSFDTYYCNSVAAQLGKIGISASMEKSDRVKLMGCHPCMAMDQNRQTEATGGIFSFSMGLLCIANKHILTCTRYLRIPANHCSLEVKLLLYTTCIRVISGRLLFDSCIHMKRKYENWV